MAADARRGLTARPLHGGSCHAHIVERRTAWDGAGTTIVSINANLCVRVGTIGWGGMMLGEWDDGGFVMSGLAGEVVSDGLRRPTS
jgi:hypothetical protein